VTARRSLSKEQRSLLARAVQAARREAEAGARESLRALAVDHHEPFGHMDGEARKLRNALRAHGRQLGDELDPKRGTQAIGRLTHEVAFEHWHRMLFARFLAENGLLMHPTAGAAVTLEECRELARDEGLDPWALAASFAQESLPQIFRKDDPALRVVLPANTRTALERIVGELPADTFTAGDALGWVYQFWQADKKDEVNASGKKIGADELPSVTQLFTEDYMVDFLLDNTLGAWWAGKVLAANPTLATAAQSEEELRKAASLPGCPWAYLRFIKSEAGQWSPAAGTFEGWPKTAAEITCLDPCMGSGHFVVAMFERMVALRMAEDGLSEADAVRAVIADNLHGLEIDPRCTQIAAFNLALAAWLRVGHCSLPVMNLACSGLAPNTRKEDWLAIAGTDSKLRNGMDRLYGLFENAPVLGSLVNPRAGEGDLLVAAFHELQPLLERALAQETKDDTAHEMAVTASGVAKAAEILAGQFTLVATNVPYLGDGKQDALLADYCEHIHPDSKADLAACFVERCVEFCAIGGSTALVTPQNWLFLVDYKHLRKRLLEGAAWNFFARLGPRAFETIKGEVVNVALVALAQNRPSKEHHLAGVDVSDQSTPSAKAAALSAKPMVGVSQAGQLKNVDWALLLELVDSTRVLGRVAGCYQGISSTDSERFILPFWELSTLDSRWVPNQNPPDKTCYARGREFVIDWETLSRGVEGAALRGNAAFGKLGIAIGQVKMLPATLYTGEKFADSSPVIIPNDPTNLAAFWCFFSSTEFGTELRKTNPKLSVNNGYVGKVPFDLARWQKTAAERYPHGLPKPFSSDPTQWLFSGHPAGADQPLHVAVARLLGYQWPRQTGSSFPDCPSLGPDGLERHADDDGIVPINPMRGEPAASERLQVLLRDSFAAKGVSFDLGVVSGLLGEAGSKSNDLNDWLLNEFFEQHCKLFHNRPFVWHIWDGRKDGFNVLVNYHQLAAPGDAGRQLLEKLTYDYLKDWIDRQRDGVKANAAGAEARLAAAIKLERELIKIIAGEPPYDLFVRWKPLSEQPIGWQPDVNDGVRLNIRPFLMAQDVGKKGAGILRVKPNIKWEKDRGKEPERSKADFPWFWSCDPEANPGHATDFAGGRDFTGERWNALHYTNAAKSAARDRRAKEKK
jgi:hypothetical protein